MTIGSALAGGLLGVVLGCLCTMGVWWLIGIVFGHGVDGDVVVLFYGFIATFVCGFCGLIAGPFFTRRWWEQKSPLRF